MTFLKHFKDEEIHKITGPVFDSSHEQVAQAAQLDAVRQVREWGMEACNTPGHALPVLKRRQCINCWQSLKELGEK